MTYESLKDLDNLMGIIAIQKEESQECLHQIIDIIWTKKKETKCKCCVTGIVLKHPNQKGNIFILKSRCEPILGR